MFSRKADGTKTVFTGELILAEGKVPDIYSFQNEIPAAKIGNYHGHLGRLSDWLQSIEKLRQEKPSTIVPARRRSNQQSGEGPHRRMFGPDPSIETISRPMPCTGISARNACRPQPSWPSERTME